MMIICPSCRAAHVQGTLFCEQCGTSLMGVAPTDESAQPAGAAEFAPLEESRAPFGNGSAPAADSSSKRISEPLTSKSEESPGTATPGLSIHFPSMTNYQVALDSFHGPLDLLLYLVKRDFAREKLAEPCFQKVEPPE